MGNITAKLWAFGQKSSNIGIYEKIYGFTKEKYHEKLILDFIGKI